MKNAFDWRRFWCPRDGNISLSDRGFLADPEGPAGKFANPDLLTFEGFEKSQCVTLLGEPGIGKTWTLQREIAKMQNSVGAVAKSFYLDLHSFTTDSRLMECLFDSEEFRSWRNGDWVLHVFLDSLDECLLRIENVANLFSDELPKQPIDRLRLRVACRTARRSWALRILRSSLHRARDRQSDAEPCE